MSSFPCELEGTTLVLVGRFNPAIFQPQWFARHGLVSEEEAEGANIQLIRPEISIFGVGTLQLTVEPIRFQVECTSADAGAAPRDLALGAFQLLEHTPAWQMGINRHMHFKMASEEGWHKVGHRLAPKDLWDGLVESPGTRSVVMYGKRPGSTADRLQITTEPSTRLHPSIYMGTNEHWAFPPDDAEALSKLLEILANEWEESQRFARQLGEDLISRCLSGDE